MSETQDKHSLRRQLREKLAAMSDADRQIKSQAACDHIAHSPEFSAARVLMLYLSTPQEVDTAPLAYRCWQAGKTVVVPKVSWDQRRMLPVEINSLHTQITTTGHGVREPTTGQPIPVNLIDMVIVPGLGFTKDGHRIGRGMGFYDRFLALPDFLGLSCGLAFEDQILPTVPILDHDVCLSMLCTNQGILRFATNCMSGHR